MAVPEQFSAPEQYDMVFALSFFTHMPRSSFGRWLKALFSVLKRPATSPSRRMATRICLGLKVAPEEIPADGFWFRADSEQKDLDTAEYGLSLTTPDFVIGEIYRMLGAPIALYRHGYWWTQHDLWVVKRREIRSAPVQNNEMYSQPGAERVAPMERRSSPRIPGHLKSSNAPLCIMRSIDHLRAARRRSMHRPARNALGSYVANRHPQWGHRPQPFEYVRTSLSELP